MRHSYVFSAVYVRFKRLLAIRTHVRPGIGVNAHVTLQRSIGRELRLANFARVRLEA